MSIKRILSRLRLDKIAYVDRPCQEGALAVMIKRAEGDTNGAKVSKALYDALEKSGLYVGPAETDGAEGFDEVLGEQELTREFWDAYYNATNALQEALTSIIKDDTVTDKQQLLSESIKQFADHIEQILPGDIGKSLAAGIAASVGQPGNPTGEVMTPELKKALGLPETATEADVLKAITDKDALLTKVNADLEIEKAKAPPPADDDEDDADMKKALDAGEAFRTPEGVVITKKAVGDSTFLVLKSQNERIVKAEVDLAKAREADEERSFAKRAEEIGCTADFGSTLRKAYAGDAAAQGELETQIQALNKQVDEGALFKTFGSHAEEGSATAEFTAKVEEVQKAEPKLTGPQAYSKAYTNPANRDIVKRMNAEQRAA